MPKWTNDEDKKLKNLLDRGFTTEEMANELNRTFKSVSHRRALLSRKKPVQVFNDNKEEELTKTEIKKNNIEVIKCLKEELNKVKPHKINVIKQSSGADTLVIHFTDWHLGKEIKDNFGSILFNMEVAKKRLDMLFNQIFILFNEHISKGVPIKDVVIISTGDVVDGAGIYESQQMNSELSPPFQVMKAVEFIQKFVLSLLDRDLKVHLKLAKGNHGEIRVGGKTPDPLNNWDLMVYLILDYGGRTLNNKSLSIEYSQLNYLNFYIQGWKYHIRHIAPIQPETSAGKAKFLGWKDAHNFDAAVYGHYHHYGLFDKSNIPIFRGGSLTGADEYAEELAEKGSPVQLVWGVNKKRPLTFLYPVDLGGKRK